MYTNINKHSKQEQLHYCKNDNMTITNITTSVYVVLMIYNIGFLVLMGISKP